MKLAHLKYEIPETFVKEWDKAMSSGDDDRICAGSALVTLIGIGEVVAGSLTYELLHDIMTSKRKVV